MKNWKIILSLILIMAISLCTLDGYNIQPKNEVYASESSTENTSTGSTVTVEGTNSVGSIIAEDIAEEVAENNEEVIASIFDIICSDSSIEVTYQSSMDGVMVVGIYDESGKKLISSYKKEMLATEGSATLEVDSLPKYFIAKAYIIQKETYKPLSKEFETRLYTQEIQELLNMTSEDFEEDRVINLDDSVDTNWVVLDENIIRLDSDGVYNTVIAVDEENNSYKIENISEEVKRLEKGKAVAFELNSQMVILEIEKITIEEDAVYFTGNGDLEAEEIFEYAKIESNNDSNEATDGNITLGEGVSVKEKEISTFGLRDMFEDTYEISLYDDAVTGTINGVTFNDNFDYYISKGYGYVRLAIDYSIPIENLSINIVKEYTAPIFEVDIPVCTGVSISLGINLVIEVTATLSVDIEFKGTVGFSVCSTNGFTNLTTKPEFEVCVDIEGTYYIGVEFSIGVKIVKITRNLSLGEIDFNIRIGCELFAEMDIIEVSEDEEIHDCKSCIEGSMEIKVEMYVEASIANIPELTLKVDLKDPFGISNTPLGNFYFSFDHGTGGFTKCPYKRYLTRVRVLDSNVRRMPNVPVNRIVDGNIVETVYTDERGCAIFYLHQGYEKFEVEQEGYVTHSQYHEIEDDITFVRIMLEEEQKPEEETTTEKATTEEETTEDDDAETIYDNKIRDVYGIMGDGFPIGAILTEDNELWMWGGGDGYSNALGHKDIMDTDTPVKIMDNVRQFDMSYQMSAVVTTDNKLYVWGEVSDSVFDLNETGNYYTYHDRPQYVCDNVRKVDVIEKGYSYSTLDGRLYVGTEVNNPSLTEYGVENVADFSCDYESISIITNDGALYIWEYDYDLDENEEMDYGLTKIMDNVKSAGTYYAITYDNDLYEWGWLDGINYTETPVKVMSNVKEYDFYILNNLHECFRTIWSVDDQKYITEKMTDIINVSGVFFIHENGNVYDDGGALILEINETDVDHLEWEVVENEEETIAQISEYVEEVSVHKISEDVEEVPTMQNESTETEAVSAVQSEDVETDAVPTVQNKNVETEEVTSATIEGTETRLKANEIYNVYVVKTTSIEDVLSNDNLLGLMQKTTDENGNVELDYELREEWGNPEIIYVKMSYDDISEATVTVEAEKSTGEVQYAEITVTMDGKTLVEGIDYYVGGTYSYSDAGNYSVAVYGIGAYKGQLSVEYTVKKNIVVENDKVEINGLQLSTTVGGVRTVYSVESTIGDLEVEERGLVYGLSDYITEDDMYVGADNKYVVSFAATSAGLISVNAGTSDTADSYAMTMNGNISTTPVAGLVADYYVRAYAKLSDGTYVYSDVKDYSIYRVAKILYDDIMMSTIMAHEYLFDNILSRVDENYAKVEYPIDNTVVKP